MAGETANIAEVASKVSQDIFEYFKWERIPLTDENFPCHKKGRHAKTKKKQDKKDHTHPVDVVFRYFDPYLNSFIYLNTDLKSYKKSSISPSKIKDALTSLARTIDCADSSPDWKKKYVLHNGRYEVRGLLFIYNHDGEFDKEFSAHLQSINLENLDIKENQLIHFIDPLRIKYLRSVAQDITYLQSKNEFPKSKYSFFHPDLTLHKSSKEETDHPATIEMLCAPFLISQFKDFKYYNDEAEEIIRGDGYVIYYNQRGSSHHEFMYLIDYLSRFQILKSRASIRIRMLHLSPDSNLKSNFEKAKNLYLMEWGMDETQKKYLDRIDLTIPNFTVPSYIPGVLAWRSE